MNKIYYLFFTFLFYLLGCTESPCGNTGLTEYAYSYKYVNIYIKSINLDKSDFNITQFRIPVSKFFYFHRFGYGECDAISQTVYLPNTVYLEPSLEDTIFHKYVFYLPYYYGYLKANQQDTTHLWGYNISDPSLSKYISMQIYPNYVTLSVSDTLYPIVHYFHDFKLPDMISENGCVDIYFEFDFDGLFSVNSTDTVFSLKFHENKVKIFQ